jgi:hypothetical protein
MSSRQQGTGSLVIDDRTASALADVFAALDWEDAMIREAAEPRAAAAGIVFGEPVGHGTIRLHGHDPGPEPELTEPDLTEPVATTEPVGHGTIRLHGRDPEPEAAPAEPVAPWEPVGHGTIRLHGRER